MSDLERAVTAVVRECLGVQEGEEVLVVSDQATRGIGERLRHEAEEAGAEAVLALMAERESHGAEPPGTIAAAMLKADVVMVPTVQSLSHTAARKAATDAGARIATLPGVTVESAALVSATGREGERLMALLSAHGPEATHVAGLGIGTNEKAILSGQLLEDEKILGTVHVAFGASAAIGGEIQVPVHLDCVVMRPGLTVDGQAVVRDGELLV